LATHYDPDFRFHFKDANEQSEMLQWLFWQNAGLGPMQGQANHFVRYAPEKIEYGVKRYANETKRLYAVLEERLAEREWIVGGKYSVVDISCFAWVRWAGWAGIEIGEFPKLKEWCERIEGRETVKRGLRVPDGEDQIEKLRRDPDVADPFQEWVMRKYLNWVVRGRCTDDEQRGRMRLRRSMGSKHATIQMYWRYQNLYDSRGSSPCLVLHVSTQVWRRICRVEKSA
jgi:hypothetical protein